MAELRSFQHGDDNQLVIQYLLGSTSEQETERLDELSIADDEFAARLRSAENDLVDSYARGELEGETLQRFKSFYLASPNRLEKVKFAEVLQVQSPTASSHRTPRRAGTRTLIWSFAGLAALLLLAAGYLVRENGRLQNDFTQEQARRIELEQRAQALQKRIDGETAVARSPAEPFSTPRILAFVLSPQTRGIASITSINLPPAVDRVAFRLLLETDDFPGYRAKLKDLALNQIIWRSESLKADSSVASRAVSVVVPGNVFKQQNYSLELTGMPAAGAEEFVGAYAFKVGRK